MKYGPESEVTPKMWEQAAREGNNDVKKSIIGLIGIFGLGVILDGLMLSVDGTIKDPLAQLAVVGVGAGLAIGADRALRRVQIPKQTI